MAECREGSPCPSSSHPRPVLAARSRLLTLTRSNRKPELLVVGWCLRVSSRQRCVSSASAGFAGVVGIQVRKMRKARPGARENVAAVWGPSRFTAPVD